MLLALAVLLVPLSVLAVWAKATLTDTDRYVATVAPLARNPDIQAAVTKRVTDTVYREVGGAGLLPGELAPTLSPLDGSLNAAVKGLIGDVVAGVVRSSAFAEVWSAANRAAHRQLVMVLTGTSSAGLSVTDGQVRLDLGALVRLVANRLANAGLTVDLLPSLRLHVVYVLFSSTAVTRLQWGFRTLQTAGDWVPVAAVAAFLGGVWLAADRRRAIMGWALGVAAAMLAFGGALALARDYYVAHLPASSLDRRAMAAAVDIVLRFLHQAIGAAAAFGALVALVAFFAGPSQLAQGFRRGVARGLGGPAARRPRGRLF